MYDIYPLRRFEKNVSMHVLRTIEYMTSISWIFVLFACFIALIEVGRYIVGRNECEKINVREVHGDVCVGDGEKIVRVGKRGGGEGGNEVGSVREIGGGGGGGEVEGVRVGEVVGRKGEDGKWWWKSSGAWGW